MKFNYLSAGILAAFAFAGGSALAGDVTSFPIGTTWPDTEGIHINCHGGCVVPHEGAFYWFGESRTGGHSDGISVYRSTDLYNWQNLGFAVTHSGDRDDENMQDISEGRLLERPKVVYNESTGKWVMWAHWENGSDYGQARVAILQADEITGPYTFVSTMRPNGHDSRDQTLFLDTDGHAYHFCSTNMNTDINVVRLADDFLTPSENETLIMQGRRLEATTVCKVDEMYFATFSECNGWDPAPGHTSTALVDPLGEWTEGLNFCIDGDANRSYRSQGAFVFSVGSLGYDPKCFIFYGDRWNSSNVGGSTYVWLPLSVRSGYPTVRNYSTWKLDDVMKAMYRYKRAASITDGAEFSLLERRSDRLLSRMGQRSGFCVKDDNDRVNLSFTFEATADPYVWKLRETGSNLYLTAVGGKLRMNEDTGSKAAEWRFVLLSDGYYNVINEDNKQCLTVASNSRADGSEVRLGLLGENDAQGFCPYFDSNAHPDYQEAAMYTKAYYDQVAEEIVRQGFVPDEDTGVTSLPFETDKPFAVIHTLSARALTFMKSGNNNRAGVKDFTQGADQKITFVAVPDGAAATGYNITDGNGNYLMKQGDYNTTWSATADPASLAAIFTVEAADKEYVIKCADGEKYLGTDGTDEGAIVYSDKAGADRKLSRWYLADFNAFEVKTDQDIFNEVLDETDVMFGSIDPATCGYDPFDYSPEAYNKLNDALQAAFAVTSDFATAQAALEAAVEEFHRNCYVLPDPEKKYIFTHSSGMMMKRVADGEPQLSEVEETDSVKFVFTPVEGGKYTISNAAEGLFLANKSGSRWSMDWVNDASNNRALWTVEISKLGGKVFKNASTNLYIGCDNTQTGSALYCDKASDALNSQWKITLPEGSAIEDVETDKATCVYPVAGGIFVNAGGKAEIFDLSGRKVAAINVEGNSFVALAPGIYVVSVNGEAVKVAVR